MSSGAETTAQRTPTAGNASLSAPEHNPLHRVVIVGGGFGGLRAARGLRSAPVAVTLVDRRNFHLFQPLLYQVATGTLSPANIAAPLRNLVKRQANVRVLLADAIDVDVGRRVLRLLDGELAYDTLILAAGARSHYFGHAGWAMHAPSLKCIEDATDIRGRIFAAFEKAERTEDATQRAALLTFVVVGAGPTGVELAGALAEIARHTLPREFRRIDTASARILLVEAGPRILPNFAPELSAKAVAALSKLGGTVRTDTAVADITETGVVLRAGVREEKLATNTVLWGAGVQGSPVGKAIAAATGASLDRAGRIAVGSDCCIAGHSEIFVIGDLARHEGIQGLPLPGVAPVAEQQGAYVSDLIRARLVNRRLPPFRYRDPGSMATIGRGLAIAQVGRWKLSGKVAWFAWLFVHLMALVRYENRLLVLGQWGWHYLTWNRSARLITRDSGRGVERGEVR
ncbi:MAG: NAD(P)/FAD-dependent oxidoreductase [Planctomycetes bacterium]|nr:NAD(P)/FAD-dependent oxidoreductase [Planctomycetota bacterium]